MIRVILIANAGIFLETGGVRIFLDAFHHAPEFPFSMIPPATFKHMTAEPSIYRDADFIMFSHNHPDHYSPALLLEYLKTNRVRRVLLPEEPADPSSEAALIRYLDEKRIPFWRLGLPRGKQHMYQLMPDVYLSAVGMQHTGEMYRDINCDCMGLSVKGIRILFTGDCSFDWESDYETWSDLSPDVVFVNPLFFHSEKGRALLHKWNSKNIVIHHIPFEGDDRIALRTLAHRDYVKYAAAFQKVHLLWNAEQELCL